MNTTVFQSILENLQADSTLTGYLGGAYIFRAKAIAPSQIPSITLQTNNERSDPRSTYNVNKHRDANPTIQIDVWISDQHEGFPCTGEDADIIANRIDEVILNPITPSTPITGTFGWSKTTESQQHEDDPGIWHNALRYSFLYTLQD